MVESSGKKKKKKDKRTGVFWSQDPQLIWLVGKCFISSEDCFAGNGCAFNLLKKQNNTLSIFISCFFSSLSTSTYIMVVAHRDVDFLY